MELATDCGAFARPDEASPSSEPADPAKSLYQPPATQQVYKSTIPTEYSGFVIEQYFSLRFPYQTQDAWVVQILNGNILVNGNVARLGSIIREGDRIITYAGVRQEPPVDRNLNVVYRDRHIRVFNKPAPIPVHPSGRYFQNSMTEVLKEAFPEEVPRPVQRLDATTTGLIVFARTRQAAGFLMREFQGHRVHKEYLAIVNGKPKEKCFILNDPIGVVTGGNRGTGEGITRPKSAITQVEWLASTETHSVLKVIPLSGRTNQIRVHLSSHGLPILNDGVYGEGESGSYDYGLHAWKLGFQCYNCHLEFEVSPPPHFEKYF